MSLLTLIFFMYMTVQWYSQRPIPIKSICCGCCGIFPRQHIT